MIAAPMSTLCPALLRRARPALAAIAVASLVLAACASTNPTGAPDASSASPTARPSPVPTTSPVPTPSPTPSYTNPPDAELEALIPATVAGARIVKPLPDDYGMTPGDLAPAYGAIGVRFSSLVLAYIEPRLLSLYAMRLSGDPVTTADLRPYLATAGRLVGIAGLHPEAWARKTIGGDVVWVRPEDNATAAGTMIYTWAAGDYVFLMIGTNDRINRALLAALPGEPAPTPSPRPSAGPSGSPPGSPSGSPSGSPAS